jgi:hypothetical protein
MATVWQPIVADRPAVAGRGRQLVEVGDIVECHVMVRDCDECAVSSTDDKRHALPGVFHEGVCDRSRPGAGQVPIEDV